MKTCILADNQFITREGIKSLLHNNGFETFVAVACMKELQEQLKLIPDALVVLDYTLFDFESVQQLLIAKAAFRKSVWLLFSEELGEDFLRFVLLTDSTLNVLMKHDPEKEILKALGNIANGKSYLCELAVQILNGGVPKHDKIASFKLTASEKVVLHEIALGKTTKEIAFEKNLSFHTVNTHRKNIFRKLGVNNLHEAIKYAIRAGIFDVAEYYI